MCTHNLCFEQKYEKFSTENCHFYSREISLYIAWECLRNVTPVFCCRNHDTEIYAFGQRFGEEFDEGLLKRAFIQRFVS